MGLGIVLTPDLFRQIATDLCGPQWKRGLARLLSRSERMIQIYDKGQHNVPPEVRMRLAEACRQRGERLLKHAEDLAAK